MGEGHPDSDIAISGALITRRGETPITEHGHATGEAAQTLRIYFEFTRYGMAQFVRFALTEGAHRAGP